MKGVLCILLLALLHTASSIQCYMGTIDEAKVTDCSQFDRAGLSSTVCYSSSHDGGMFGCGQCQVQDCTTCKTDSCNTPVKSGARATSWTIGLSVVLAVLYIM